MVSAERKGVFPCILFDRIRALEEGLEVRLPGASHGVVRLVMYVGIDGFCVGGKCGSGFACLLAEVGVGLGARGQECMQTSR